MFSKMFFDILLIKKEGNEDIWQGAIQLFCHAQDWLMVNKIIINLSFEDSLFHASYSSNVLDNCLPGKPL